MSIICLENKKIQLYTYSMSVEAVAMPWGFAKRFQTRVDTAPSARTETPTTTIPTIEGGFVETKTLEVSGRNFQAYTITPNPSVEPQGRILFASGWRTQVATHNEFLLRLVQAGFTVSTFDNNFTQGDPDVIKNADRAFNNGRHPVIEFVKAKALETTLHAFPSADPQEEVGIVAQSEGTIYSALATLANRNLFSYWIQINAAGLAKRTSIPGIITKGSIEALNCHLNHLWPSTETKTNPLDVVKYVTNNLKVAVPELRAIATMRTQRIVEYVKNGGIPTGLVNGRRDKLFPIRNVRSHIDEGLFDHVSEVDGAHEISTNPEGYAEQTLVTIAELRAQRGTQQQNVWDAVA